MITVILAVPSMALDNGYSRVVYNVRGLQDYDLHWNDRFPQGSTVKIYAEADGINHRREVAVDYVFIIRDASNNIIDTALYSNRFEDYRADDFITYTRTIPQDWDDGAYKAEVHIFDLLNDSVMDTYYNDLIMSYLNETDRPDLPIMNRSNATKIPNQHMEIVRTFFVDKYASKYPSDRFRIENIAFDRTVVAPDIPVTVSATVTNTFYDKGSTSVGLMLDNVLINTTTVDVDSFSKTKVFFTVSSGATGNHTVEIIPSGNNTIGLNLSGVFTVSTEEKIEAPTQFVYQDIQIDNLSVAPNQTAVITVTVRNIGKEGTQPVDLYINDNLEEEKQVDLNFSETRDIKFNVTKVELGAYRVTVDKSNLSKVFFVESATPQVTATQLPPAIERKPQLDLVVGLSIIVIAIYILRRYLRNRLK